MDTVWCSGKNTLCGSRQIWVEVWLCPLLDCVPGQLHSALAPPLALLQRGHNSTLLLLLSLLIEHDVWIISLLFCYLLIT